VTQGNLVNEKDMQRIEIGMTKEQVDFLIGRPILIDPFNKSVWEYVYLAYYGYQKPIKRKMTFTFDGDVLAKKEGSLLPEKNSNTNEFGDSAEPIEIKEASD
jgi:outer membrane protein assembly factor BamE